MPLILFHRGPWSEFIDAALIVKRSLHSSGLLQVFEAVISWTSHEMKARLDHVSQLMEHVRLPLLPQEFLVQRVEEEPLVKNNTQCKDFLIEAMKFHLLKPDQKLMYKTPRTRARTPIGLPKVSAAQICIC